MNTSRDLQIQQSEYNHIVSLLEIKSGHSLNKHQAGMLSRIIISESKKSKDYYDKIIDSCLNLKRCKKELVLLTLILSIKKYEDRKIRKVKVANILKEVNKLFG